MATTLANLRAKLNGEIGVISDSETSPWSATVRNNAISDGFAALWRAGVWKPAKQDLTSSSAAYTYALTSIRRLKRADIIDSDGNITGVVKGHVEENGTGGYQLILDSPVADGFTIRVYGWTAYKSTFGATGSITSSSVANPTVITTGAAHGLTTGDSVVIAGHTGSTPSINGTYTATVTGTSTFTIPVNVSVGGTGGTFTALFADATADDLDAEYSRIPLLKAKAILYRQVLATFARYGERQALPPEMNLTVDQAIGIIAAAEREFADECRVLSGLRTRTGIRR
ncbi:MAG: hypothetical protein MUE61_08415 [Vicinamibacterales bacterium]|nr:hypothetical protein [Vicinamibacterales bacterium]MCU0477188.1 hypothetical protein [Chloroflexota bacterium]MCU0562335.1 hypothetical protein [Desulfobacterales bacterium]